MSLGVDRAGIALRYSVFSPLEMAAVTDLSDKSAETNYVFIPDGRTGYEALEIAASLLGRTHQIHVGTGVIRIGEHDPMMLARRLETLQAFSGNRCFLGIGTGSPGPNPRASIGLMLDRLQQFKVNLERLQAGIASPEVWIAALRIPIARRVMDVADGLLLNFCSPSHVALVLDGLGPKKPKTLRLGCYLKVFFSAEGDDSAKRLLVQEFLNYDSIPQYHEMFMKDGVAQSLTRFRESGEWRTNTFDLPSELLRVSVANPSEDELRSYVKSFTRAGLQLPIIYPYFPTDEGQDTKIAIVRRVLESVR